MEKNRVRRAPLPLPPSGGFLGAFIALLAFLADDRRDRPDDLGSS